MRPIDPENSPCVGICKIVEDRCAGCNRTIAEITEAGIRHRARVRDQNARRMKHPQCRGQGCEDCNQGWITRQ